jgi:hypothetical protein
MEAHIGEGRVVNMKRPGGNFATGFSLSRGQHYGKQHTSRLDRPATASITLDQGLGLAITSFRKSGILLNGKAVYASLWLP